MVERLFVWRWKVWDERAMTFLVYQSVSTTGVHLLDPVTNYLLTNLGTYSHTIFTHRGNRGVGAKCRA